MFKHLLWVVLFSFFSFPKAQALIFIEPIVGYSIGELKLDASSWGTSFTDEFDLKGVNFGGRGGLELGNWQLGIDYLQNNYEIFDGHMAYDDNDSKAKELAAFLGYRFWFMRIYGGVIFKADLLDSGMDPGKGVKAGLSFYAFRHLALNLEYRTVSFNSVNDDGILMDIDYNQIAFLVSFPFGI